jgi:carboxyl-terminal processing protease
VLDLRNCAAGEESEGIATANLFLNHGTITYLEGQKYPREAFNADPSKAISTLPLAVPKQGHRWPGGNRRGFGFG